MEAAGAPWPAAVAVSGGGDSLALMLLLGDWAASVGLAPPVVVTVDHKLRPESAKETKAVSAWARRAGLAIKILSSPGMLPQADLEAEARALRYRLIGEFARKKKLKAVYVAHTQDDQAETFLLRLARGSGVDGLAAMQPVAPYPVREMSGLALVRPLLGFTRKALRDHLEASGQTWIEDPMNGDPRFHRVRIRQAWTQLSALGLTPRRVGQAAAHLGRARMALEAASGAVLARACRPLREGGVLIDPAALVSAPEELALRALATILMRVSGNPYRPRFERLTALFAAFVDGSVASGRTLHGCRIGRAPKRVALFGNGTLLVQPEKSLVKAGKMGRTGK